MTVVARGAAVFAGTQRLDLVNQADGFAELAALLVPGGRAASTLGAANAEQLAARGVQATNVSGAPDPALLTRLAALADAGQLRVVLHRVYPLEDAGTALAHMRDGHVCGKLAIAISG